MKNYIQSFKVKGVIREINNRIEDIIDSDCFVVETTTYGDYPDERTFVKIPKGKEIIKLSQAIVNIVKDYYEVKEVNNAKNNL